MSSIKKILVPVDLSDQSSTVAAYANLLAQALDAEIFVVYITPSLSQYIGFHLPASSLENFAGEVTKSAEKTMEAFLEENFKDVKAKGEVIAGYASEEIIAQGVEFGADLIVMGTHGRTGLDRILFGSVAEKVVKTSSIPVLTVRPKAAD